MPAPTRVTASGSIVLNDGLDMGDAWVSDVIDFKDMVIGSIQIYWSGVDAVDGSFTLKISNLPEGDSFVPYETAVMTADCNAHIFLLTSGFIGFRYAKIEYTPNSVSAGTAKIIAVGKKSGGII